MIRREGTTTMPYLRPDAKSQVTMEYDDRTRRPLRVHTIVVSTQHDEFILPGDGVSAAEAERRMQERIREDVRTILMPRVKARLERAGDRLAALIGDDYVLHVNPTGKFVIGGPHGDTGLTGRKIIVDTYGGRGAHGGGAFSGKDSSKVDRSAAYAARHIAKNMVAAGIADEVLVELSYAIGIAQPLSVYVDTYGTNRLNIDESEIAERIGRLFDLRPAAIVRRFGLKNPIFEATASYGHFGNRPFTRRETVWEEGRAVEARRGVLRLGEARRRGDAPQRVRIVGPRAGFFGRGAARRSATPRPAVFGACSAPFGCLSRSPVVRCSAVRPASWPPPFRSLFRVCRARPVVRLPRDGASRGGDACAGPDFRNSVPETY